MLRLRRATKPEHDGEDDQRRRGKELRLPVLEGFEPEPHVPEVGDERMLGTSMQGRVSRGRPAIYHMLSDGTVYADFGAGHLHRSQPMTREKALVRQIERLGFACSLSPAVPVSI
jgi:hypothetical protein